ncbi:MAG TPA: carbohydrate kinase [Firmicutes bacterium]|nr:carbohydrate kinase [Bacillota bacterium]
MNKLIAIGELLIDFVSEQNGSIENVNQFNKLPGGAPANVACCVSKLGGRSAMITKLGEDPFGNFLEGVLRDNGVDTTQIYRTKKANTGLAFVSLEENGERDFTFYRNPSADLFLEPTEICKDFIVPGDILHFGSVDLVDYPIKQAHEVAIQYCHELGALVSFDPNVRLPLWENHDLYRERINEFIPKSHLLKISEDELEFITGEKNEEKAIKCLFKGYVKLVFLTKGKDGVVLYSKNGSIEVECQPVKVIDTTGAGDSFIGAILYQLLKRKCTVEMLDSPLEEFEEILNFANQVATIVVTRKGAISALPSLNEVISKLE